MHSRNLLTAAAMALTLSVLSLPGLWIPERPVAARLDPLLGADVGFLEFATSHHAALPGRAPGSAARRRPGARRAKGRAATRSASIQAPLSKVRVT